jgi:hypothetical protein
MAEHPEKEIWFPAKRFGWGWGLPCAWQGWVVLGLWLLAIILSALLLMPRHPWFFQGVIWTLAATLIAVCRWKGDKPRWRWGKD